MVREIGFALIKSPSALIPESCASGSYYCSDGKCHSGSSPSFACASVPSRCGCGVLDPKYSSVPCLRGNTTIQYVTNQNRTILVNQCSKGFGVESPAFVQYCSPQKPATFSLFSRIFIIFYLLAGLQIALMVAYLSYRRKNLIQLKQDVVKECSTYSDIPIIDQGVPSPHISFTGYQEDMFGTAVRFSIFLCSSGWLILVILS
jgi:hypothetical protein